MSRKGREVILTGALEVFQSKDRILEEYLNVVELGERLATLLRPGDTVARGLPQDTVARLGGDEFADALTEAYAASSPAPAPARRRSTPRCATRAARRCSRQAPATSARAAVRRAAARNQAHGPTVKGDVQRVWG